MDIENRLRVARVMGGGGWAEEAKGLRSTHWQLQGSHRDGKYSKGHVVSSIVITVRGARWVLGVLGRHKVKQLIIQPLCCEPKSNTK